VAKIFFNNDKSKDEDFSRLVKSMKKAFTGVRSELDDHLESINQNTSELQSCMSFLSDIDKKMSKLSERLDELEIRLNPSSDKKFNARLTPREQEVFITLYVNGDLSIKDISRRVGFTEDRVNIYIMNLIGKGIPIERAIVDDVMVFALEKSFRELQAKKNVLNVDSKIVTQVNNY
jgi:predicted transcriptional regulator